MARHTVALEVTNRLRKKRTEESYRRWAFPVYRRKAQKRAAKKAKLLAKKKATACRKKMAAKKKAKEAKKAKESR